MANLIKAEKKRKHTLFPQVVRLLVHHTWGPPLWLGLLGVASGTRSRARRGLATVVGVSDLLARFNELDKGLGNHAAVELLEVLESALVVAHDLLGVSDAQRDHLVRAGGQIFAVRALVGETVIGGQGARSISAAASDSTGRCFQSACLMLVKLSC